MLTQYGQEVGVTDLERLTEAWHTAERLVTDPHLRPHIADGADRAREALRQAVSAYAPAANERDVVRQHLIRNSGR